MRATWLTTAGRCMGLGLEFTLLASCQDRMFSLLLARQFAHGIQDVPALIRYPSRQASHHALHHASTYRLATILTIPLALSLLLFWTITHGSVQAVLAWELLPQSYLAFLAICFILPFRSLSQSGRYRFLSTLKRVSVGGLAQMQDGKFGDILLADVLTSYAKVLGDLFVSCCMLFSKGSSSTAKPDRGCGGAYLVPLIIGIPSIIRLRQCLIEFVRVRNGRQPSHGWGGQHLANALKYASAFPVIVLSALQRGYDPAKIYMSQTGLFRLWYCAPRRKYKLQLTLAGFSSSLSTLSTLSTGM